MKKDIKKRIETVCDILDDSKVHYSLVVELPDGGFSFSGKNTAKSYLGTVIMVTEHYLNDTVPPFGTAAVNALTSTVRNTIDKNGAVPNDRMEQARLKMYKLAKEK